MNIEQLKNIIEVSKTQSISLASRNLHLTQAAVSRSISSFENEINIQMFERTRDGTKITPRGEIILKQIFQALESLEEIKIFSAKANNTYYEKDLFIGAVPSLFLKLLPKTLSNFKEQVPFVDIKIEEDSSKEIIEKVVHNELDLGLVIINDECIETCTKNNIHYESFMSSRMVVCTNDKNPIADKDFIYMKELINFPIVLYKGYNWNHFKTNIESSIGDLQILFTTNNSEVIKHCVSEGLAISVLSEFMIKQDYYFNKNIRYTPLIDYDPKVINFGLVYKKKHQNYLIIEKFVEILKQII